MSIHQPIIILGAPRSGTTILQRCLALHDDLWHLPGESHTVLEGPFHPVHSEYGSNRVTEYDCDDALIQRLRMQFYRRAVNLNAILVDPSKWFTGNGLLRRTLNKLVMLSLGGFSRLRKPEVIRLLEKTPKNALRLPALERLFPDALYIWNKRRPADNIDSLVAGWHAVDKLGPIVIRRRRFAQAGYPIAEQLALKDYSGRWWKFALVPGWRDLKSQTVADVAAWQYYQCNRYILEDLQNMNVSEQRVFPVKHESFIEQPVKIVRQIVEWANLPPCELVEQFASVLPRVNEANPQSNQEQRKLRYPNAVYAAMERLSDLESLRRLMGY